MLSGKMSHPEVSGVSPKEGLPGTKVTIRGQNLGTSKDDVKCKSFFSTWRISFNVSFITGYSCYHLWEGLHQFFGICESQEIDLSDTKRWRTRRDHSDYSVGW